MDEYAKALDQVAAIAKDKEVDAVLIAGDVFDSPAPPPEAEKLVYNFLAKLVSERIQCVLIAGNHDHPPSTSGTRNTRSASSRSWPPSRYTR